MSEHPNIRQISLVPGPIKGSICDALRALLADAEKGEVLALVVVSVRRGQEVQIFNEMQSPDEAFRMTGALEMAKHTVLSRIVVEDDDG